MMREEEERLHTPAKNFRTFELNQLGFYGFDCLYEQENPVKAEASFIPSQKSIEIWKDAQDPNFRILTVLSGNK